MVIKRTLDGQSFYDDGTPSTIGGPGTVPLTHEDYELLRVKLGLPDLSRDAPTGFPDAIRLPPIYNPIGGPKVNVLPPVSIPQVPILRPPVLCRPLPPC